MTRMSFSTGQDARRGGYQRPVRTIEAWSHVCKTACVPMPTTSPIRSRVVSLVTVALGSAFMAACDPVYTNEITVVIPAEVQQAFSPASPGVVIADSTLVARLCAPTNAPIVAHTSAGATGCGYEREIEARALFVSQLDTTALYENQKPLLDCGETSALDVRDFAAKAGPASRLVPSNVEAVARGTGVVFKGSSCKDADGEPITIELQKQP